MTRHKKKPKKQEKDWRTTVTILCLMLLIGYATYYAYGETQDILAFSEMKQNLAVYLDYAKVGQYVPKGLPCELVAVKGNIGEIRIWDTRDRGSYWAFMLITPQGKILAIGGRRFRL